MAAEDDFPIIVKDWYAKAVIVHTGKFSGRKYMQISDDDRYSHIEALIRSCRNAGYQREFFDGKMAFQTVMKRLSNPTAESAARRKREDICLKEWEIAAARVYAEEMTDFYNQAPVALQKRNFSVPVFDPLAEKLPQSDYAMSQAVTAEHIESGEPRITPKSSEPESSEYERLDKDMFKNFPPVIREYDEGFLAEIESAKSKVQPNE